MSDVDYKKMAEDLWDLLDDISTAGDMFKPEHTPYYKYVNAKAEKRGKYLESDGYKLYLPGAAPPPAHHDEPPVEVSP